MLLQELENCGCMHFEYLGEVEGIKHGKTYEAILQNPGAAHAEFPESKKATPKDGLYACYVWLPDLGSNQGPAD